MPRRHQAALQTLQCKAPAERPRTLFKHVHSSPYLAVGLQQGFQPASSARPRLPASNISPRPIRRGTTYPIGKHVPPALRDQTRRDGAAIVAEQRTAGMEQTKCRAARTSLPNRILRMVHCDMSRQALVHWSRRSSPIPLVDQPFTNLHSPSSISLLSTLHTSQASQLHFPSPAEPRPRHILAVRSAPTTNPPKKNLHFPPPPPDPQKTSTGIHTQLSPHTHPAASSAGAGPRGLHAGLFIADSHRPDWAVGNSDVEARLALPCVLSPSQSSSVHVVGLRLRLRDGWRMGRGAKLTSGRLAGSMCVHDCLAILLAFSSPSLQVSACLPCLARLEAISYRAVWACEAPEMDETHDRLCCAELTNVSALHAYYVTCVWDVKARAISFRNRVRRPICITRDALVFAFACMAFAGGHDFSPCCSPCHDSSGARTCVCRTCLCWG